MNNIIHVVKLVLNKLCLTDIFKFSSKILIIEILLKITEIGDILLICMCSKIKISRNNARQ